MNNLGQLIGSVVDAAIWVAFGFYLQFYAARQAQTRVEQGTAIFEEMARFKRKGKWLGWLLIALGVAKLIEALTRIF